MTVAGCCGLGANAHHKTFWLMLGLVLLSSLLLIIKERSFAREVHKLTPILASLVPSSCVPNPQNDGLYVHLECPIRNSSTFYPPSNFAKNISAFRGVFFEIKAEMFQFTNTPKLLSTSRTAEWVDHLLASGLRAGGYTLPGSFSGFFREKQQLSLEDDGVFEPEQSRPPRKIDSQSTLVYNNHLYTGSPLRPQVGDIRISFWGNKSTHVSLIGKQLKPYFGSGRTILDAPTDARKGEPITILAEGDYSPQSLIEHRLTELGFPASSVWTWRAVAFLTLFAFVLFFNAWVAMWSEENPLPVWARCFLSALIALATVLLELAAGWWTVEATAARRLAMISGVVIVAAGLFRLLLPRILPQVPNAGCSPPGAYYDLGVCLQAPNPGSGSGIRLQETSASSTMPTETKQGTVIRWTTTPARAHSSAEDALRRSTVTGTATYVQPSSKDESSTTSYKMYTASPMQPVRASSLTNMHTHKSSSNTSL
ncbi:uncharacterized protein LOC113146429 [Cyclospora cayetanensis]|uniref:Uncharacterized protein LOC113146429 n=1 Tax=Cyclospora cayetanensis TaxID=88456 RepID=A0A6P6RPS4_9EIME|nr:uncharacterized protein LOC113146429 [Cyclospora cayetanensis]